MRNIVLIFAVLFSIVGCCPTINTQLVSTKYFVNDTIYNEFMSDSIVSIIYKSDRIVCELPRYKTDSIRIDTLAQVSQELGHVSKFLILDPENFKHSYISKGMFQGWASLEFLYKSEVVKLELDFGLNEWCLKDYNGNELCTNSLGENRRYFLKLLCLVFPNDRLLNSYYNKTKIEKK